MHFFRSAQQLDGLGPGWKRDGLTNSFCCVTEPLTDENRNSDVVTCSSPGAVCASVDGARAHQQQFHMSLNDRLDQANRDAQAEQQTQQEKQRKQQEKQRKHQERQRKQQEHHKQQQLLLLERVRLHFEGDAQAQQQRRQQQQQEREQPLQEDIAELDLLKAERGAQAQQQLERDQQQQHKPRLSQAGHELLRALLEGMRDPAWREAATKTVFEKLSVLSREEAETFGEARSAFANNDAPDAVNLSKMKQFATKKNMPLFCIQRSAVYKNPLLEPGAFDLFVPGAPARCTSNLYPHSFGLVNGSQIVLRSLVFATDDLAMKIAGPDVRYVPGQLVVLKPEEVAFVVVEMVGGKKSKEGKEEEGAKEIFLKQCSQQNRRIIDPLQAAGEEDGTKDFAKNGFPYVPGYAYTFHQLQSQTFHKLIVQFNYPDRNILGQLTGWHGFYVVLTRMRCVSDLRIVPSQQRRAQPTVQPTQLTVPRADKGSEIRKK